MPITGYGGGPGGYVEGYQKRIPPLQEALNTGNKFKKGYGSRGLYGILEQYFLPELANLRQSMGPVGSTFMEQAMTPGALFESAGTAAAAGARKLFEPGGEVASLLQRARGGAIQRGFAPSAAEGVERSILDSATKRVADTYAENAVGLEQARFAGLGGLYGQQQSSLLDLIYSLYTGAAGAEQLKLAQPRSFFKKIVG